MKKFFYHEFILLSIVLVTALTVLKFVTFFEWAIVANALAVLIITITIAVRRNHEYWKRYLCLSLFAFVYIMFILTTYYWSEVFFFNKTIDLASAIERSCIENKECIRGLPGWEAGDDRETGARLLSTKWRFFPHSTSVHYLIQPDKKSFYLQEIYQHGRVTTVTFDGNGFSINHEGSVIGRIYRKDTGNISLGNR